MDPSSALVVCTAQLEGCFRDNEVPPKCGVRFNARMVFGESTLTRPAGSGSSYELIWLDAAGDVTVPTHLDS